MAFTTRPELAGTFGMVTSTHWLASQAGMAILEEGGNAFDAATAAGFVLHVVEPHLNGPGGDMPLIFRTAGERPVVLCGQGVAPQAATIETVTGLGLNTVPGTGLLAAAVPGAVPAWLTLLRDHGTMTPAQVLRFAIGYAESGHPALARVVGMIDTMADFFTAHWPTSAATWLPAPAPGALLRNPVLAETYTRLVAESEAAGPDREAQCDAALRAWSQGFVAEAIDRHSRQSFRDSSGSDHAGLLTGADLAAWTPTYETPMSVRWRGHEVFKAAGWTQGPAFLQTLALIDPLLPERLDELDAATIHTIVEAQKLAFADRDAWFGDAPDAIALDRLLDPAYLEVRRSLIGGEASTQLRPGGLGGDPRLPAAVRTTDDAPLAGMGAGEPTVKRDGATKGDTCHIDVVDRWGNAVSATPSGGWLQSSPTVPELGFCLGTRMQMVWLEPGFGSSLAPGRRPRTTLSPSLAVRDDDATLPFGTPGGDQQDQWPLVFWLRHTLAGDDLQAAIDHPSFNITALVSSFDPRTWVPAGLEIESRYPATTLDGLRERGHRVTVRDGWSLGRISAALHDPAEGVVRAAANPRGMQGYAVGR